MKCNGLDLSLFQFDYDLTFAALFLNADRTVYARYGLRTAYDADKDVAIEGLVGTMQGVLDLHRNYPNNKESLNGKQPNPVEHQFPEEYEALDHFKPTLNYDSQVAKSCIHCHQVRDARRWALRNDDLDFPEELLYPYPAPHTVGIEFDVKSTATIKSVSTGSIAATAGLAAGDTLKSVNDQPIVSAADLVWVLHNSADGDSLDVIANRRAEEVGLELKLPQGWRKTADIEWRPTSWDMRRMATGGAVFEAVEDSVRERLDIPSDQTLLHVKHVGQYGHHARAKKAGVKKGDYLVGVDGRTDFLTESSIIEYAIQDKKAGDDLTFELLRNGRKFTAKIKLQ